MFLQSNLFYVFHKCVTQGNKVINLKSLYKFLILTFFISAFYLSVVSSYNSMGIMSAVYEYTTRPPDAMEPYAESEYHHHQATVMQQPQAHNKLTGPRAENKLSGPPMDSGNTNCNNENDPGDDGSGDPSRPVYDPFSTNCDADLEVICHIVESPYVSVDRKWFENTKQGSCKIDGMEKGPFAISGTQNTNQSNQASVVRISPEGADSVINPGYSSIDKFRDGACIRSPKHKLIVPVREITVQRLPVVTEAALQRLPSVREKTRDIALRARTNALALQKAEADHVPALKTRTNIPALKARTDIPTLSSRTDTVPKMRECNTRNKIVLPGRAMRINSTDGQSSPSSSVASSNSSVNLLRHSSNCSDLSINTSRTRVIRKDRVKWGTLDHRKLEEVTPSKFVEGRYVNPWDTWQEATFGRLCRWFCSSERRNIPSQKVEYCKS